MFRMNFVNRVVLKKRTKSRSATLWTHFLIYSETLKFLLYNGIVDSSPKA